MLPSWKGLVDGFRHGAGFLHGHCQFNCPTFTVNRIVTSGLLHPTVISREHSFDCVFSRVNGFGFVPDFSLLLDLFCFLVGKRAGTQIGCPGAMPLCEAVQ
jgi:hypothetical protein